MLWLFLAECLCTGNSGYKIYPCLQFPYQNYRESELSHVHCVGPGQLYFLAKSFSWSNKWSSWHSCRCIFVFCFVLFVGFGVFLAMHLDNFICASCLRLSKGAFGSRSSPLSQADGSHKPDVPMAELFYSRFGCWIGEYWLCICFLVPPFVWQWIWGQH